MIKLKNDFSNLEEFEDNMCPELLDHWEDFKSLNDEIDYTQLIQWQKLFDPYGLTFDFGLDGIAYDFEIKCDS